MSEASPEKGAAKRRAAWRRYWWLVLAGVAIASVAGYVYWDIAVQGNLAVVVPGELYRSAQPSEGQLEEWIPRYGLKSILCLRHSVPQYEEEMARRHGIHFFMVPLSAKTGLTEEQWLEIRTILTRKENLPLLYHCQLGADRTGIVTARYRIEVQGWSLGQALREMERHYHFPARYPVLQRQLRALYGAEPLPQRTPVPAR